MSLSTRVRDHTPILARAVVRACRLDGWASSVPSARSLRRDEAAARGLSHPAAASRRVTDRATPWIVSTRGVCPATLLACPAPVPALPSRRELSGGRDADPVLGHPWGAGQAGP